MAWATVSVLRVACLLPFSVPAATKKGNPEGTPLVTVTLGQIYAGVG